MKQVKRPGQKWLGIQFPGAVAVVLSKRELTVLARAKAIMEELRERVDKLTGEECTDTDLALAAAIVGEFADHGEIELRDQDLRDRDLPEECDHGVNWRKSCDQCRALPPTGHHREPTGLE